MLLALLMPESLCTSLRAVRVDGGTLLTALLGFFTLFYDNVTSKLTFQETEGKVYQTTGLFLSYLKLRFVE